MSDVLTIHDLIESNQCDDIDKTAKAVEGALGLNALQRQVLHPLIADHVRRTWRTETRDVEPRFTESETVNPAAARSDYLSKRFALGDGRYVKWGEATVEDHQQRIDMLSKLRHGLEQTIAAHEQAIEQIEAAEVTCLNDLVVPEDAA